MNKISYGIIIVLLTIAIIIIPISVSSQTPIWEDFEDGDGWGLGVTEENAIFGQFSFYFESGSDTRPTQTIPESQPNSFSAYIRIPEGDMGGEGGDSANRGICVCSGTGSADEDSPFIGIHPGGDVIAGGSLSFDGEDTGIDIQDDTVYKFYVTNIDYTSETFSVRVEDINENVIGTHEGIGFNPSGVNDQMIIFIDDGGFVVDDIAVDIGVVNTVNGTVVDGTTDNVVNNTTITAKNTTTGEQNTATTDSNGEYTLFLENGTYNITANHSEYINVTKTNIEISNDTTVNFTLFNLSDAFEFDVYPWMEHGSTQSYSAIWENSTGTYDITETVNVTSLNTTVVTVDNINNELIATNDLSINQRIRVEAEYENNTVRENITVANQTIDNIGIMPSERWLPTALGYGEDQASFGIGSEIQWILVAIAIGATAAWSAKNEWMGVGVIVASITLFWVLGRVDLSIMLTALFYGILAGYQLQQTPSRSDTDVGGNLSNPFE